MSDRYYATSAARMVADAAGRVGAPVPWELLFSFVLAALDRLIQCKPTPQEGYEYITWRPRFWFPKSRLAKHRAAVEGLSAPEWTGTEQEFRATWDATWKAVDDGKLTRPLMAGLYTEARG